MGEEAELDAIWREFRPATLHRVDVIRDLVRAPRFREEADLRERARVEAHTLAGSAALFGMRDGAATAGDIEALLSSPEPLDTADVARLGALIGELRAALDRERGGD